MSEIRVSTIDLQSASQTLHKSSNELLSIQNQTQNSVSGIGNSYDGQLQRALDSVTYRILQTGIKLQNQASELGDELQSRAAGFEAANDASVPNIQSISVATIPLATSFLPPLGVLSVLQVWKDKALSLWKTSGLEISGFLSSITLIGQSQELLSPVSTEQPIKKPASKSTSAFGELLKEPVDENIKEGSTPPSSNPDDGAKEDSTPTKLGELLQDDDQQWWTDVPTQSQQGLTYNGKPNAYGCTPTSTSMILDYWHNVNSENKTLSAQELLNINVQQKEFSSTGMSASNIHDEVANLGYSVAEDHMNSNLDDLRSAVKEGPVIAIVKLGIKTSGENHAVVVTGISPDNQIRINDPWDGKSHTYTWDEFSKSWGADFGGGKDGPKNNFVVIRP